MVGSGVSMKTITKILVSFLCLATPALAQNPVPAGHASSLNASVGYTYLSLGSPSSPRVGLNGLDLAVTANVFPRLGVTADCSYALSSRGSGTGRTEVLSYLFGPVFFPARHRGILTYVRGLVGGARVSGPIVSNGAAFAPGWVNNSSWAFGGGVEYSEAHSIHFRVGADYQHTQFFDSSAAIRGQNDLRTVVSVGYSFGLHRRR